MTHINTGDQLCARIAAQLLQQTSWHMKGRYGLLVVLAPRIGSETLLALCPSLPSQLVQCMSVNSLHQAAGAVYGACLKVRGEKHSLPCSHTHTHTPIYQHTYTPTLTHPLPHAVIEC